MNELPKIKDRVKFLGIDGTSWSISVKVIYIPPVGYISTVKSIRSKWSMVYLDNWNFVGRCWDNDGSINISFLEKIER